MKKIFFWIMVFFATFTAANAQPGFLDTKFGDSGRVFISNTGTATALLQKDGKIFSGNLRFFADGRIDSSFGVDGNAVVYAAYIGVCLQEDGKILITGGIKGDNNSTDADIFLQRLSADGIPDSSFGINSVVLQDFGFIEEPYTVQVAPDGKIVVAGNVTTNFSQNIICPFTARFMPDGSVDETYGQGGETIWTTGAGSDINAMLIQPDGKIIIGGAFDNGPSAFLLLRYDINGLLDKSFGNDGAVINYLNGQDNREYINAIALIKDGKILAAGTGKMNAFGAFGQMAIVRYNNDGSMDETFGKAGAAYVKFEKNYAEANSVAVQHNGKIVLSGNNYNYNTANQPSDFALARLTEDGILDSAFGINGKQVTDFDGVEISNTVLIQADGKILSIGVHLGSVSGMLMCRYFGDPTHPLYSKIKRWISNHILHFEDANTNAAYYVIEKSTTTNTGFVPVTKITANAATNNYSYTLPEAATQSTYRIKAVNKDNSITYSSPISSDPAKAGVASFKVYPNPAKDRITVETSGTVQLRLQNSNGRVLLTQTVNGKGSIDISKLPNGIYYVVNTVNGESLKVVKE